MTDLRQKIDTHLRGDARRESPIFPYKDWVRAYNAYETKMHYEDCVGVKLAEGQLVEKAAKKVETLIRCAALTPRSNLPGVEALAAISFLQELGYSAEGLNMGKAMITVPGADGDSPVWAVPEDLREDLILLCSAMSARLKDGADRPFIDETIISHIVDMADRHGISCRGVDEALAQAPEPRSEV